MSGIEGGGRGLLTNDAVLPGTLKEGVTARVQWGLVGRICVPFCEFMQSTPAAPLLPRASGLMVVLTSISLVSELPQQY